MSAKQTNTSGHFSKGTSGNPSGRPPGSRNHTTVLMESLLEGEAEQLTRKAIELALAGDITALRLCLERLLPPRRDRPVHLVLPPVENVKKISLTMAKVTAAISEGKITPTEGEALSNILTAHKDVLVAEDLERRVKDLERRMSSDGMGHNQGGGLAIRGQRWEQT
jgi:translation elongation factor EF-Tu-like GTPase